MIKDFFLNKLVPDKIENIFQKKEEEKVLPSIIDLRETKRTKERGKPRGLRQWKDIDTLMLHQTGANMSANSFLNVPAHCGVSNAGVVVLLNDPNKIMNHGHTPANSFSIGIEISCREPGVVGDPRSFWVSNKEKNKGKTFDDLFVPFEDFQVPACFYLIEYYIDLVAENGGEIKYIMPHRSGHSSRTSDPGEAIWKKVAIPAMALFDLKLKGPVGSGTPIPTIWDPDQIGVPYNWQIKGY